MIITKIFKFESAHKLNNYHGKCANLHGHSYTLYVSIKGKTDSNGLVMDFCDLKDLVNKKVVSKLDHTLLNKIVKQPTLENLAKWTWNRLENSLNLYEIKLWETDTSYVTYKGKY
jgi:6-pyruvoyltetrahydropterin/6-carboxytetrahydropterin synthase